MAVSGPYSITATTDVTFGGFGVRVSVTAPPASQVYALGPDTPCTSASRGLSGLPCPAR